MGTGALPAWVAATHEHPASTECPLSALQPLLKGLVVLSEDANGRREPQAGRAGSWSFVRSADLGRMTTSQHAATAERELPSHLLFPRVLSVAGRVQLPVVRPA